MRQESSHFEMEGQNRTNGGRIGMLSTIPVERNRRGGILNYLVDK